MKYIFKIVIISISFNCSGQICGTILDDESWNHMESDTCSYSTELVDFFENEIISSAASQIGSDRELELLMAEDFAFESINVDKSNSSRRVAYLNINFFTRDDGSGGISLEDFEKHLLKWANEVFAEINLSFEVCEFNAIENSEHYNTYISSDEDYIYSSGLSSQYNKNDRINIYITKNSNTSYAYYPGHSPEMNHMLLNFKQCHGTSTFIHELGHYFGLHHTFGPRRNSSEYVNGLNCNDAGDRICDTPADLKGLRFDRYDCTYTDDRIDDNGDLYSPDLTNFMSYYKPCRSNFTTLQKAKMNFTLLHERSSILSRECIDDNLISNTGNFNTPSNTNNTNININGNDELLKYMIENFVEKNEDVVLKNTFGLELNLGQSKDLIFQRLETLEDYNLLSNYSLKK